MEAEFPGRVFIAGIVSSGTTPPDPCGAQILGSTAGDPCTVVSFTGNITAPGDYVVIAAPQTFSGTDCSKRYHVTLTCVIGTPCTVTCPPGGIPSDEPVCSPGYVDEFNNGCNSTPPTFENINCNTTVCGTSGTFPRDGGSFRDLDFYRLVVTAPTTVTWTVRAEFAVNAAIFDFSLGCPLPAQISLGQGQPCEDAVATATLLPGEYLLLVGPQAFGGVPCGADYTARLDCDIQQPCDLTCPPGSRSEGEPDCGTGYVDTTNPGCNGTPETFGTIACGDTLCGTSGTYLTDTGGNARDTDWFRLVLTADCTITWTFEAEFPANTGIIDLNGGCAAAVFVDPPGAVAASPCQTVTLNVTLTAGTYVVFVSTQNFTGVPCGSVWFGTLSCNCGATCIEGDANGDGVVDFDDIDCFVAALVSQTAWETCSGLSGTTAYLCACDINDDGVVDFDDIDGFVLCLTGSCP
jgi:hypothetical protein